MSNLLIVDDEAIISMQLGRRLTTMGYTIAGMAASGEDAIEKARSIRPDLVLMDIVMPGKMDGIDAAKIITKELGIPVVFITSYADDTIIEKAKSVRPYGYIVKPFNELELKAAIEVALFRKAAELEEEKLLKSAKEKILPEEDARHLTQDGSAYLDLPEIKTILLKDIFTDLVLFLYTETVVKDPIFKFALEEGIKKGGRNLFAYSHSTLQKYFLKEIQKKELFTYRIKRDNIRSLAQTLEQCTGSMVREGTANSLQVLIDFSETDEFGDILAVRKLLLAKKDAQIHVSGMIALNIGKIDHNLLKSLAEGIPKIIVSTGNDTTLSFAHHTFPAESVSVVRQSTIDDAVKKSLEPVVLSFLDKPISGNDILHEIHTRYKVLIPQARVYTILHELQENGFLEMKISGKSKLFCPTEKGKNYIDQKLDDYRQVFQHILGYRNELNASLKDKR